MGHTIARLLAKLALAVLAMPAYPALAKDAELDETGLRQMLENLGYEQKEDAYDSGSKFYTIEESTPDMTVSFDLSISKDAPLVWMAVNYWSLKEGQDRGGVGAADPTDAVRDRVHLASPNY